MKDKKVDKVKQALESMIIQFGYRGIREGKPMIWTGGLSTLEEAFGVLGWNNPHYLPEQGFTCEIIGCIEEDTCGTNWGKLYLRLCSRHYKQASKGKPCPPVKQWALAREATRVPGTHCLPIEKGH